MTAFSVERYAQAGQWLLKCYAQAIVPPRLAHLGWHVAGPPVACSPGEELERGVG